MNALPASPSLEPEDRPPVLLFGDAPVPQDAAGEGRAPEVLRADLDELLEGRLIIEADPGAGKTQMNYALCEQTAGTVPQIIIDPEAEYAGLRSAGDYVLASADPAEGDVLAHPKTAAALTRFLTERNLSAILNIFELDEDDRELFVAAVGTALLELPRSLWTPRILLVEEAEMFAPQDGSPPSKKVLRSVSKRGRKRGVLTVFSIQRISDFSKAVAGGIPNKLVGRTAQDVHNRRAAADLGLDRAGRGRLKRLPTKRFLATGPAFGVWDVAEVDTAPVETRPSRKTARFAPPPPPPDSLREDLAALAELTPDDADDIDEDPGRLRREIAHLRERLGRGEAADPEAVRRRVEREVESVAGPLRERNALLEARLRDVRYHLLAGAALLDPGAVPEGVSDPQDGAKHGDPLRHKNGPRPAEAGPEAEPKDPNLPAVDRALLGALRDLADIGVPALDRRNLFLVAGHDPAAAFSGGREKAALRSLMRRGLLRFPDAGSVEITPAGQEVADEIPFGEHGPLSLAALHGRWLSHLPAGEARLLRAMLDAHPEPLTRKHLAARAGFSPGGGGFNRTIKAFADRGLAELPARQPARLTRLVFPEGLT